MLAFQAMVSSRSSTATTTGAPGDAEVLSQNPQRRDTILQATGWQELFPGTLNLEVAEDTVHRLLLCKPTLVERGDDVTYPEPYAHIPRTRVGYLYYCGRLLAGNATVPILVRRACNPLKDRLEALSAGSLREALGLADGDTVQCEVDDQSAVQALA